MNSLCHHCGGVPTKFCICGGGCTMLCDMCTSKHNTAYPYEMHDANPTTYWPLLQNLGVEGFRMQKLQIMNGASLVRKLQETEARQYAQAKQDLQETYQLYDQWLDFMHSALLAIIQRFEQEKMVPMTSTQFQLSPFTYFIFSTGDIGLPSSFSLTESQPVQLFKQEVANLQQKLYKNSGAAGNYEEYFVEFIKGGLRQGSMPQQGGGQGWGQEQSQGQMMTPNPGLQGSQSYPGLMQTVSSPPSASAAAPTRYILRQKNYVTYIPFSRGGVLAKWNTRTGDLTRIDLKRRLNLTKHVASVILPSGDLCCCGGHDGQNTQSLVIDGISGEVYRLGELTTGRSCLGLVYCYEWLFVFGGFGSSGNDLKTCEKYGLKGSSWMPISNEMTDSRHQFNPAVHERLVYIAGGLGSRSVETFHVVHETFRTNPIQLPKAFGTIALVNNGELIVLQERAVLRWKLGSDSVQVGQTGANVIESNVAPQTFGNKVFFDKETDSQCEIFVLDLNTMTVSMQDGLKSSSGEPCQLS